MSFWRELTALLQITELDLRGHCEEGERDGNGRRGQGKEGTGWEKAPSK